MSVLNAPTIDSFYQCLQSLRNHELVYFDGLGKFHANGAAKDPNRSIASVIHASKSLFDELEQHSVKFYDDQEKKSAYISKTFTPYFTIYHQVQAWFKALSNEQDLPGHVKESFKELQSRFIALRYRMQQQLGDNSLGDQAIDGLNKANDFDQSDFNSLCHLAKEWKKKSPFQNKELHEWELIRLKEAAKYKEWVKFIILDENCKQREEFFSEAIKNFVPVDALIQCPATTMKKDNSFEGTDSASYPSLRSAILTSYIGGVSKPGDDKLEVTMKKIEGGVKKILSIPVYHGGHIVPELSKIQKVNILNPNKKITFLKGGYTLTVREIFDEAAQKNVREPKIIMSALGLENWHPTQHGYWDAKEQKYVKEGNPQEGYLKHAPFSGILTEEELVLRYGSDVKGKSTVFKVMAARKYLDLSPMECHAFAEVAQKIENTNQYKIVFYGKYANRFQLSQWDAVTMLCDTLIKVISLLDQSAFNTYRQIASYVVIPEDEKQAEKLLKSLEEEIQKEGVFQFSAGESCAAIIQKIFHGAIPSLPNFFKMNVYDSETSFGPLNAFLRMLKNCSRTIQWAGLAIVIILLGSLRGQTIQGENGPQWRSVFNYYWDHTDIFCPAALHERISKGEITGGQLSYGNVESRFYSPHN